jgi:hypothetical protein
LNETIPTISPDVFVTWIVSGGQCCPNYSNTLFLSSKFSGTLSMIKAVREAAAMLRLGPIRRSVSRELLEPRWLLAAIQR